MKNATRRVDRAAKRACAAVSGFGALHRGNVGLYIHYNDGCIPRAYNAEMLAKRLERELELERQKGLLLGLNRFFGPEFLAGVLVGALVCLIVAALFS